MLVIMSGPGSISKSNKLSVHPTEMKINNQQRAEMARGLIELQRTLELHRSPWFSYSSYSGFSAREALDPDGKIEALARELEAKYHVPAMKEQRDELEAKINKAAEAIQDALKVHNERVGRQRETDLKAVKLAICDIWVAETVEDAKK